MTPVPPPKAPIFDDFGVYFLIEFCKNLVSLFSACLLEEKQRKEKRREKRSRKETRVEESRKKQTNATGSSRVASMAPKRLPYAVL